MQTLNLPAYDFKIRNHGQNTEIFDCIRRKFVVLTPEEWVRQHFIMFLSSGLGYPLSLMSVEKGLEVNTLRKRTDIVVHDRQGKPWMIVECKAPDVSVNADTLHQASGYHEKLQSRYIVVTNGIRHLCCEFNGTQFQFLKEMPQYPS